MSANLKRAVKRIKAKLNADYETAQATPTAGPVGTGKAFIAGQVFDGTLTGVTQVVNVGRPAAAQYAPKVGGGVTVVSGGGGSTTTTGSTTALTSIAFLTLEADATLTNERYLAVSDALTKTDGGAGAALTLGLATPGSLSVSSTNVATGAHTHAITSSSNPGAAASLLASDSSGFLTLPKFVASTKMTTPTIDTASGTLSLRPANATAQVVGALRSTYNTTDGGGAVVQGILDSGNSFARAWFGHNAKYDLTSDQWNIDNVGANDTSGLLLRNSAAAIDFIFHASTGATSRTMDHTTFAAGAKFTMTSAGRFGVLNTSPTYELDVNGTMRAATSLTTPLITTATNTDLLINPAGTGAVTFQNDQTLRTSSFDSSFPITGWQVNEVSGVSGYSALTIGKIQADELAVRVFVADEVRVDRGDEYWTKSYGIVAESFTTPASIGGTVSVKFEDSPALAGAIFTNNDWVLIRKLDIDTGITLSNIWGQVATYVNNSDGSQNWTFTLRSGPTSESVTKGSLAIDFGASGAALIHLSVIDAAGAPYIKMRKWSGANPYTPSNFTTYIQLGELSSTGNSYYTPSGYGLYIRSTANEDQFMVADDNGLQIRGPSIGLYNSTTQTILMNNTSGINVREDVWGSWDNRRALQWWPDVGSMSGDPSLSMYTGKVVGGLTANQNFSYIDANPTGNVLAGLSITAFGQGTASDATLYLEGGSQSLTTTPSITMTATSIDLIAAVDVTGSLSVGGTAVSLAGHTHSYLPLSGGTLTGTVVTDVLRPATNNTKTVGDASYYYNAGYFNSLYVNTIVGTPSYSHTHAASDITSGTLDFARIPTTWTGALNLDADAAGSSNYVRWTTQTGSKSWDLVARAHDYTTTASQQNDLLLTYFDGSTTHVAFHADSDTRVVDFNETPTVDGTAVSLSGHTHAYTSITYSGLTSGHFLKATGATSVGFAALTGSEVTTALTYTPVSRAGDTMSGRLTVIGASLISTFSGTAGGAIVQGILDTETSFARAWFGHNAEWDGDLWNIDAIGANDTAGFLIPNSSGSIQLIFHASTGNTSRTMDHTTFTAGEKFRFTSAGRLGVLNTSPSYEVDVTGSIRASTSVLTPTVTTASGNLTLTSTGGTVAVTGALTANSTAAITTSLTVPSISTASGNLAITSAGGTVAVTGALTGSSTAAFTTSVSTPIVTTASGNLSLTSTGGTVAVTGALTGSSTGVFTSTLTAASDTDAINTFGRVRLGYAAATDTASFSHFDNNTSTNFALSQNATGATTVNAASGQTVDIQVAGVSQWTASSSRLNPRSSVVLDIGDYNRRVRTLHAAELAVETLVAQNIMATIGGRIIVAPTVKLIADLANSGTATSFNTNLTAYWSLDEASGNRSDSRGTQTLTDTNTVASTGGKKSSAANFTGSSSEKLNRSDNSTLSVGDIDFFFSLWIYPTLNSGSRMTLINKGSSGSGEYRVEIDWATSTVRFLVANAALASTEVTSSVTISTNSWYFVTAWHDSVNNVIGVGVNGNEATAAHTTGVRDSTGNFCLGARDTDQYYTGYMDEVGFWKNYIPSAHERRWLYNQYTGRAYTEINTQVQSTIDVDGNSFASGDFIYLSAAPGGIAQVESMMVSSSASAITGGYRYTVVRDHDGSGLNSWYVGDAAIDIGGTSGGGYIDLTSTSTIQNHYGPTIAVYQRDDYGRWNDVVPTAALGNLRSFLDYDGDTSGMAVGNDLTLTPSTGFKGLAADATNGLRLFNTDIELYSGSTQTVNIDSAGTDVWLGPSSSDKRLSWNGTTLALKDSDVSLYTAGTKVVGLNPTYGLDYKIGSAYTDEIPTITWRATAGTGNALARVAAYQSASETGMDIRVLPPDSSHKGSLSIVAYNSDVSAASGIAFETPAASGTTSASLSIYGNNVTFVSNPLTVTLTNGDLDMNGNDIIDIGNVVGNISTWTTLTLNTAGNWANYGGSYFNAAYKKIGDLVFLRGLVKRTSGTNTLIATMPVGYRPTSYILRSTSGDDAFARIDIENDGEIRMQAGTAAVYISLDGLWFSTA